MQLNHCSERTKFDKSDRKSLEILVDKLLEEQKLKRAKPPIASYSQRNSEIFHPASRQDSLPKKKSSIISVKRPSSNVRDAKQQSTKITKWLSKKTSECPKNLKQLDVTITKTKKITSKMQERKNSFAKYGMIVPTYEKILADQKLFENHKKCVESFDMIDHDFSKIPISLNDSKKRDSFSGLLLDCKNVSLRKIDQYFEKYRMVLERILNGQKHSSRHQHYHNIDKKNLHTIDDLIYCTNTFVFTDDQKDRLIQLMCENFDREDKLTDYFFKVLLPEVCLFIFMDEHNMSKRKAQDYLNRRPID